MGADAARQWQALIRLLSERLAAVPVGAFYDAKSDRYHSLREQIWEAFYSAHLADETASQLVFLPRLPDITLLTAHLSTMPADLLALHVRLWFSAERWGVATVNEMFEAGLLQKAMRRFADERETLPFVTYDIAAIERLVAELKRPDLSDGEPDRSDGGL